MYIYVKNKMTINSKPMLESNMHSVRNFQAAIEFPCQDCQADYPEEDCFGRQGNPGACFS